MARTFDFVVIGGGIVGLALARELKAQYPQKSLCLFEKEDAFGMHASGRNSGVLHSGIYYAPGSLKARVSVEGRRLMTEYCLEHGLPLQRAGKVILPVREGDDEQLELLLSRAKANSVRADLMDTAQLREIEPQAHSLTGKALYVPDASVVEPRPILAHIAKQLQSTGAEIRLGTRIHQINHNNSSLQTQNEEISFGHLYSAAGAYADVIAKSFGIADHYTILPFKGIYYKLNPGSGISVNHLIYAVPDLRVPFLGVHFMKTVAGEVYIGPTVIPAFGRENYGWLQGLNLFDTSSILFRIAQQYARNKQGFRRLVTQEGRRFLKQYFAQAAQALVPDIRPAILMNSDKVGIRSQLLDTRTGELVMDFLVEKTRNSTHVLNAVSPAFTSSFAFAKYVLQENPAE